MRQTRAALWVMHTMPAGNVALSTLAVCGAGYLGDLRCAQCHLDKGKQHKNAQRHTTPEGQTLLFLLYMAQTKFEYPFLQHGKCFETSTLHFSME